MDTSNATHFTSLSNSPATRIYTTKMDDSMVERDVAVTLRVRGAGGTPVVKKGTFTVSVDPSTASPAPSEGLSLVPSDRTPPPSPVISGLTHSLYFSDTPNTLSFSIEALRDIESGIKRVEYKIDNKRGDDPLQDWTILPISTNYFTGRVVETSLPAQEEDLTIQVTVRVTNESGLQSEAVEELDLDLDDSPPSASIQDIIYYNPFTSDTPNSLEVKLSEVQDLESGIDRIEYTILQDAQVNLASVQWADLVTLKSRPRRTNQQSVFLPLETLLVPETKTTLSLFVRTTNGAGLQTVVNETIELPGTDQSPPTDPTVLLDYTGFFTDIDPNHLRIIVGGSRDLESSIERVTYRVIDGQTGDLISDWDDFVLLNTSYPTYILPTTERSIHLPDFENSRSIIVEVLVSNKAGLSSNKIVRFLPIELDGTPPVTPSLRAVYFPKSSPVHPNQILNRCRSFRGSGISHRFS